MKFMLMQITFLVVSVVSHPKPDGQRLTNFEAVTGEPSATDSSLTTKAESEMVSEVSPDDARLANDKPSLSSSSPYDMKDESVLQFDDRFSSSTSTEKEFQIIAKIKSNKADSEEHANPVENNIFKSRIIDSDNTELKEKLNAFMEILTQLDYEEDTGSFTGRKEQIPDELIDFFVRFKIAIGTLASLGSIAFVFI